jgi:hypothetical protein
MARTTGRPDTQRVIAIAAISDFGMPTAAAATLLVAYVVGELDDYRFSCLGHGNLTKKGV